MSAVPSAIIHVEPEDVAQRLMELGLQETIVRKAIWLGFGEHRLQKNHDPDWYRGGVLPAKTTRFLRDDLVKAKWKATKEAGLELTVHPSGSHSLVVWSGDAYTAGLPPRNPSTKQPRGEASRIIIAENQQGVLFGGLPQASQSHRPTWALLVRAEESQVLAEVSLPSAVSHDGHVETWHERIILGTIDGPGVTSISDQGAPKEPFQVTPLAR